MTGDSERRRRRRRGSKLGRGCRGRGWAATGLEKSREGVGFLVGQLCAARVAISLWPPTRPWAARGFSGRVNTSGTCKRAGALRVGVEKKGSLQCSNYASKRLLTRYSPLVAGRSPFQVDVSALFSRCFCCERKIQLSLSCKARVQLMISSKQNLIYICFSLVITSHVICSNI